jgi:hypothetical protein
MSQQINLLQRKARKLPRLAIAVAAAGLASLVLAAYGQAASRDLQRVSAEAENSDARLQQLRSSLAKVQQARSGQESSDALAAEVAALKIRNDALKPLLESARGTSIGTPTGYADHLAVLALSARDDVWLTGIVVSKGGQEMLISGRALRNEAVTQYVQALNAAYRPLGIRFNHVEIQPEGPVPGRVPLVAFKIS